MKALAQHYKHELLEKVVPFWLQNSQDLEYGGYFSCLDREGRVYDTDKFVWLQAREVWMFAKLYNVVEPRPEWLTCAKQGAEFLKKYAHDGDLNFYFALTREGRPLVQPYNIFPILLPPLPSVSWPLPRGAMSMPTWPNARSSACFRKPRIPKDVGTKMPARAPCALSICL